MMTRKREIYFLDKGHGRSRDKKVTDGRSSTRRSRARKKKKVRHLPAKDHAQGGLAKESTTPVRLGKT